MELQQQRAEETHKRILEAATRCFGESGYDATGVAKICQEAGVSKGAFYHHFSSKQALFLELLAQWMDEMDRQLEILGGEAADASDRLLSMTGIVGAILSEANVRLPMYLEFWTRSARDPAVWQRTIEPYRRYRNFFAGIVTAGVSEGTFQKVNPQAAASAIVALAVGLLVQGLLDPDGADWEQASREGMELLLNGLKSSP
jgi:AcrR family transcriptional regulator